MAIPYTLIKRTPTVYDTKNMIKVDMNGLQSLYGLQRVSIIYPMKVVAKHTNNSPNNIKNPPNP